MFSFFKIVGDSLEQVCLSLEGYGTVCLPGITDDGQLDEPFDDVPEIEEDVERFLHLPGVDALMSFLFRSYGAISSGEENPTDIDIAESRWRDEPVSYYLHWRMN